MIIKADANYLVFEVEGASGAGNQVGPISVVLRLARGMGTQAGEELQWTWFGHHLETLQCQGFNCIDVLVPHYNQIPWEPSKMQTTALTLSISKQENLGCH